MLFHTTTQTQVDQLPALLFVPEVPRWPLENILMALPDGDTHVNSAINWTIQFARSCQSSVTVLPLLPPVPSWYGSFIRHSTHALLAAEWVSPIFVRKYTVGIRETPIGSCVAIRSDLG
jgi:hypothetical protein